MITQRTIVKGGGDPVFVERWNDRIAIRSGPEGDGDCITISPDEASALCDHIFNFRCEIANDQRINDHVS